MSVFLGSVDKGFYKWDVINSLEKITKHTIGSNIYWKPNGKHKTISFYDVDLGKYFKCTLKYGSLISNIREDKELN